MTPNRLEKSEEPNAEISCSVYIKITLESGQ